MQSEQGALKYLITMPDIQGAWDGLAEREQTRVLRQHEEFTKALQSAGAFVAVYHLHPRQEAKTVRQDEAGQQAMTPGPYSDHREYMGGAYVIEADSIDKAVEWARRGRFMVGANEVRQVLG